MAADPGERVAVGVDLVDVARVARLDSRHELEGRVFTAGELRQAGDGPRRHERLAVRFAAKEAVLKAFGTGKRGSIAWTDAEVVTDGDGRPSVALHGELARLAADRGLEELGLSLSHAAGLAVAFVVARWSDPGSRG